MAAIGLALSISLQACAHPAAELPKSTVVAVKVDDPPPAELTRCPVTPVGFPEDAAASMPPEIRDAAIRLAKAYALTVDQLRRLIAWTAPAACPAGPPK